LLGTRTETAQDVGEVFSRDVDIVVINEGAVANVVLITAPEVAISVVRSVDHMAILADTNKITVAISALITPALLDGETDGVSAASRQVLAHVGGHGGVGPAVALVGTGRPHVVMVLRKGRGMRQTLVKCYPLVLDGVFVACRDCVEDVGARDGDTRGSIQLAGGSWLGFTVAGVLGVPCAVQHVGRIRPLNVTKQLLGHRLSRDVRLLIVQHTSDVSVEDYLEVGQEGRSWVRIDCLEAVIGHLVGLDADVDIIVLLLAGHAQLASVRARVLSSVQH